jgi:hypothetical protein
MAVLGFFKEPTPGAHEYRIAEGISTLDVTAELLTQPIDESCRRIPLSFRLRSVELHGRGGLASRYHCRPTPWFETRYRRSPGLLSFIPGGQCFMHGARPVEDSSLKGVRLLAGKEDF